MRNIDTVEQMSRLAGAGELIGLFKVPGEVYHAGPGLSSSSLKHLLRSPAHYLEYKASGGVDSQAMRNGRIVHAAVLEPEVYAETYVVAPEADRRTTAGKEAAAAFLASSSGKTVISQTEAGLASSIAAAVAGSDKAATIFSGSGGMSEIAVFWVDDETGVLCKAMADRILGPALFDLKTTQDARPEEFQRSIAKYGYHISAAFYSAGFSTVMPVTSFSWIAVESSRPHGVGFFTAGDELLAAGRYEYRKALEAYTQIKRGDTQAYSDEWTVMKLPAWYGRGYQE